MGTVYKKRYARPIPKDATIAGNVAKWKSKGKTASAPLTKDGKGMLAASPTYAAKYRDGTGRERVVSTGCKDKTAALSILSQLERRAERIRAGLLTAAEGSAAEYLHEPI